MAEKLINREELAHFKIALIVIFLSIVIPSIAFISEERNIAGYAASAVQSSPADGQSLQEFDNVKSLGSLVAGNYYIDGNGIVYWIDDSSNPAMAKVNSLSESQKNRHIYIDNNGNVGYVIS